MDPKVVRIQESNAIGANGQLTKVLVVTYTVGSFGPFTLNATQAEVQDGTAMARMQEFARSLQALPLAGGLS